MSDPIPTGEYEYRPVPIRRVVKRFEAAVRAGENPDLDAFLEGDGPDRWHLLIELIHSDIELRLRAGRAIGYGLADYLVRYPGLAHFPNELAEVLATELRCLVQAGGSPVLAEYEARYPGLGRRVREVFRRVGTAPPEVPGYEVQERIAAGGMGVVYRARQVRLGREAALKVIRGDRLGGSDGGRFRERFQREAAAVAAVSHPHVVQVYEAGEADDTLFLAMELIDGPSLQKKLDTAGVLSPRAAAELVEKVARAVHAVHQRGIVHRDLKPDNVLLTSDGTPKVTDFGLARPAESSDWTLDGVFVGTPEYSSPEQAAMTNEAPTPRTDVYGLGAVLYACLTGRPPFPRDEVLRTLEKVRMQPVVPVREVQPDCPRDLETICAKCLEKEPGRRYASAEQLAADLRRWQDGIPIVARPVGRVERGWKWVQRNRVVAVATLVSGITMVAGATASIGFSVMAGRHETAARQLLVDVEGKQRAVEVIQDELGRLEEQLKQTNTTLLQTRHDMRTALVGGYLGPFALSDGPTPLSEPEQKLLWTLSGDKDLEAGLRLVRGALADEDTIARLRPRATYFMHATVGLDPARKRRAVQLLTDTLNLPNAPLRTRIDVLSIGAVCGGLPPRDTAAARAEIIAGLKSLDHDQLASWVEVTPQSELDADGADRVRHAMFTSWLDPRAGLKHRTIYTNALRPLSVTQPEPLLRDLVPLMAHMDARQSPELLVDLVCECCSRTRPGRADWVPDAERVCERLCQTKRNEMLRLDLARTLGAICPLLRKTDAAQVAGRCAKAIAEDFKREGLPLLDVSGSCRSLAYLSPHLDEDARAGIWGTITTELLRRNSPARRRLPDDWVYGLVIAIEWLPNKPDIAQAVCHGFQNDIDTREVVKYARLVQPALVRMPKTAHAAISAGIARVLAKAVSSHPGSAEGSGAAECLVQYLRSLDAELAHAIAGGVCDALLAGLRKNPPLREAGEIACAIARVVEQVAADKARACCVAAVDELRAQFGEFARDRPDRAGFESTATGLLRLLDLLGPVDGRLHAGSVTSPVGYFLIAQSRKLSLLDLRGCERLALLGQWLPGEDGPFLSFLTARRVVELWGTRNLGSHPESYAAAILTRCLTAHRAGPDLVLQQVVELLKCPCCVGSVRRVLLDILGSQYGRRYEDVWAVVQFASDCVPPKPINLTKPARQVDGDEIVYLQL